MFISSVMFCLRVCRDVCSYVLFRNMFAHFPCCRIPHIGSWILFVTENVSMLQNVGGVWFVLRHLYCLCFGVCWCYGVFCIFVLSDIFFVVAQVLIVENNCGVDATGLSPFSSATFSKSFWRRLVLCVHGVSICSCSCRRVCFGPYSFSVSLPFMFSTSILASFLNLGSHFFLLLVFCRATMSHLGVFIWRLVFNATTFVWTLVCSTCLVFQCLCVSMSCPTARWFNLFFYPTTVGCIFPLAWIHVRVFLFFVSRFCLFLPSRIFCVCFLPNCAVPRSFMFSLSQPFVCWIAIGCRLGSFSLHVCSGLSLVCIRFLWILKLCFDIVPKTMSDDLGRVLVCIWYVKVYAFCCSAIYWSIHHCNKRKP